MSEIGSFFVKIGSEFDAAGINKARDGLNKVAALAGVMGAAFVAAAVVAVKAAAEEETAQTALAQAMINAGTYTKKAFDETVAYAKALMNASIYTDEAIYSTQQMLIAYGLEGEMLNKVTAATLDLAAGKKIDLVQAATLVAKSIGSETNALVRMGIEIEGNVSGTKRATMAVDGISKLFAGQAKAATLTFTGQLIQLKNRTDEINEAFGAALIPILSKLTTKLSADLLPRLEDFAKDLSESQTIADNLEKSIRFVITAFIGLVAVSDIASVSIAAMGASIADALKVIPRLIVSIVLPAYGLLMDRLDKVKKTTASTASASELGWEAVSDKIKEYGALMTSITEGGTKDVDTAADRQLKIIDKLEKDKVKKKKKATSDMITLEQEWINAETFLELDYIVARDVRDAVALQKYKDDLLNKLTLAQQFTDAVVSITDNYTAYKNQSIDNELNKSLEAETLNYENRKAWINANILDETERTAMLDALEESHAASTQNLKDEAERKEKELKQKMKVWSIAEAVINTAIAVTKAWATGGPFAGPFLAALSLAAGALQIATIKAQKFAAGAFVTSPTPAIFGEAGPEIALPLTHPDTTSALAVALEKAGASSNGIGDIYITVPPITTRGEARRMGDIIGDEIMRKIKRSRQV